jgi:polyhydroxyalkanoate synthase
MPFVIEARLFMSLLTATRDRVGRQFARNRARLRHVRQRVFDREALVKAGQTPFEVLHDDGLVSLRYYPPLAQSEIELADGARVEVAEKTQRTPLVIVPPLAVNMLIYDLFPQRSLVRYLRARGFELYLVDWGRPSRAQDDLHLADYFDRLLPAALDRVRTHSGVQRLNLHG